MADFFRERKDGIDLFVRLTPRSSADGIDGIQIAADRGRRLAVRVRAVPEKGKANAALEMIIADHFGLRRSAVTVISGSTSRLKTVHIEGDATTVRKRIEALGPQADPPG